MEISQLKEFLSFCHRIHQVRSYGSNLAVNVWWHHHVIDDLDYATCTDPCDPTYTLSMANTEHSKSFADNPAEVK